MALSKNITEFEDCREHLDRALASPNGIKITLPSKGMAIHMRQRLYRLRQLEKIRSTEIYEIGDDRRNKTPYDNLSVTVVDDAETGIVEIRHVEPLKVENL